jgi:hypothetical protein
MYSKEFYETQDKLYSVAVNARDKIYNDLTFRMGGILNDKDFESAIHTMETASKEIRELLEKKDQLKRNSYAN